MYFQNFGSFVQSAEQTTKFQFQVHLVDGSCVNSSSFPKEGYAAAIEAIANFHAERAPFLLWSGLAITAIPYDQIQQVKLLFQKG